MIENENVSTGQTEGSDAGSVGHATQGIDLDAASSWKFQGETYTPDQWTEIHSKANQYGEASKYIEEDKRYWANVNYDIEKVLKDPSRAEDFKQVYPERFHVLLDRVLNSNQRQDVVQGETNNVLPREIGEKLSDYERRLQQFEQKAFQAEVQAASARIDAILPNLLKKYELADQEKVLFEAEKFLNKGGKLTDAVWERLVREDHQRTTARADKFYQAKLKSQLTQAEKGKDTGAGGATPGAAPVKPKSLSEAGDRLIAHLKRQGY